MATVIRNTDPLYAGFCTSFNALKVIAGAGAAFHLDACEMAVTAPTATDLPTSLALCNALISVFTFHFADTLAHKVVDATSLPALGAAVDLASAITAANLMKASYNTHRAATTKHYTADATNATTSADATDLASLETLVNELKTDLTAHMASAPATPSLRLIGA